MNISNKGKYFEGGGFMKHWDLMTGTWFLEPPIQFRGSGLI